MLENMPAIRRRPPYRHSRRPLYRHSRVSGNPEMTAGNMPVYAIAVLDSRLRGNDGREGGGNGGKVVRE